MPAGPTSKASPRFATTGYQRHVDGLRAVAVLSVIFYHFGQSVFSGGFVGVDVFFVISGYLISGLILGEMSSSGRFDFKRFYIRRMRRLFPAMAVTFVASLVCAVLLFSPDRLQAFSRSLSAAVLSVSNIVFWMESGYFDAASHLKPLLHTWSLGVEEQFYFIWPALLWLTCRRGNTHRAPYVLAVMGLISLALNALWVGGGFDADYATTIFYLTPFRIFELVIGAMALFLAPLYAGRRWLHEASMLAGLTMIALAVFSFDDSVVFPYYNALLPCIGALLVILARDARITAWVLTNRLAVGLGLISYSLYLVHWPLLVFYGHYRFEPLSQTEYALLFAVTVLLSTLMYFYIEKPLRRHTPSAVRPAPQKVFVATTAGLMLAIAAAGAYGYLTGGKTPFNSDDLSAATVSRGMEDRFRLMRRGCQLRRLDEPAFCHTDRRYQILILENSHEPDGYNIFSRIYAQRDDINLISFGTLNNCQVEMRDGRPVSSVSAKACDRRTALLSDPQFVAGLDGVVLSSNQPFDPGKQVSWEILKYLQKMRPGLPTVVLGSYINTYRECADLYNRYGSFDSCKEPRHVDYNPLQEREGGPGGQQALPYGYLFIEKTSLLCSGKELETCEISVAGVPAFYDGHHLSLEFTAYLGEKIAGAYGGQLAATGFPAPSPAKRAPKTGTK